jgi:VanZ family protein
LQISWLLSRDFLCYWLPPLAWCGVVLVISGDLGSADHTGALLKWLLSWLPPMPPARFNLIHFYVRKALGHFGNYAFLYFLWFRAIRGQLGWTSTRAFFLGLGFCLALTLMDEGHQFMFASRTGSLRDVALDLSGVLTAALVIAIFWPPRVRSIAGKQFSKSSLRI